MEHLKFKDISVGDMITWHPDYHMEEWRDPPGPLMVTDVFKIDDKTYYVGFKCQQENCERCKNKIVQGHHKLIKKGGLDLYGWLEITKSKNRDVETIRDQPTFIKAGP